MFVEIDYKILRNFEAILEKYGLDEKNLLVLSTSAENVVEYLGKMLEGYSIIFLESIDKNTLRIIKDVALKSRVELLIACGGGQLLDFGKYLAYRLRVPLISMPSILSTDAIASFISILRIEGIYRKFYVKPPIGVIVDLYLIKNSPEKFTLAGLGDLISNLSSVYDWELSNREVGEKINYYAKFLAYYPAKYLLEEYKKYKDVKDLEFLKFLASGLISSGMAMNVARSSRPASGSEHCISHALDELIGYGKILHGIQVGFSTLLTLYLQNQIDCLDIVRKIYDKFGFPTSFEELGIDREIFIRALEKAPRIRDRYTVLNKYSLNEIKKVVDEVYD